MSAPETDILLYTFGTPNGQKASIALEELGLKYETYRLDITTNIQKEDWFLKINPNGRIPAVVDRTKDSEGKAQNRRIFEGVTILLYLTERYDPHHKISYPYDSDDYWETVNFLAWQHGGLGPMQGQANHFVRYAPEQIPYAIDRYVGETKRLVSMLDHRLAEQAEKKIEGGPWLVGDRMTVADIASFSWVNLLEYIDLDPGEWKHVKDWCDRINARPAVQRGLSVPDPFDKQKMVEKKDEMSKKAREWMLKSQDVRG